MARYRSIAKENPTMVKKGNKGGSDRAATGLPAELELFRELPSDALAQISQEAKVESFGAGHVFFKTGEPGKALYILEKGHVRTYRTFGDRKLIIAELGAPAIFGEMGCVGQRIYHCIAEGTKPTQVRAVSREQVERLLEKYPSVAQSLLDMVSRRYVNTLVELEATSFRHLIPRLAKLLLARAEDDCVDDLTHAEIAERLRVYRESATSALGELRKAGIVAVERKRIRILDRERLERAARE
ncbi:MAG: Crp/Fnr family transcriptional regulator [Acidobacteria bacterium]|nr:Crp/Fnr family transcriptional regulator [Acidobacteriota bacterium]MBS1864651.1 Crp/Fnr family transcriptional regulator [Acidobacteriota bacterium]